MENGKFRSRLRLRPWESDDIPAILACLHARATSFVNSDPDDDLRRYETLWRRFPAGQILAEKNGLVVGFCTTLIVELDDLPIDYRHEEMTGNGSFSTHNPHGDTLFGVTLITHPDFSRPSITRRLDQARQRLLKKLKLRRLIAYSPLPGYRDVVGRFTPDEYVAEVRHGSRHDSALTPYLAAGYDVRRILLDYVWEDSTLDLCAVLEIGNEMFPGERRRVAPAAIRRPARKVRVCSAQYLLRDIRSWEGFQRTTEYFVEAADTYRGQFLVLPEMFTAQLLNLMPPEWDERRQIHELAGYCDRYRALFVNLATKYSLYIIGGSTPIVRDGQVYNVAHLFTPGGHVYTQDKLHPTPSERRAWNLRPGQGLSVFETSLARIAIQVCYDIEFPEPTRLLTLAGAEIIFVPYSTDDRKGHSRVSLCARARAIENSIFVVTAGNAGTMMNRGYLLNHAESAVYTPSDYGFPPEAIAGRAEPNEETVVVADLDLGSLQDNRESGSTRPLYDRRTDLFDLQPRQTVQTIRVR